MNVRIISYRKAKSLDKFSPRGFAFGYPSSAPIWGNWAKAIRNDGGFSKVMVELANTLYILPLCCIKQKYAREALINDEKSN